MDELRVIKPDKNRRISHDDLEWIGAYEFHPTCCRCDYNGFPLYEMWGNEGEYYCAKCLIEDWEQGVGDGN